MAIVNPYKQIARQQPAPSGAPKVTTLAQTLTPWTPPAPSPNAVAMADLEALARQRFTDAGRQQEAMKIAQGGKANKGGASGFLQDVLDFAPVKYGILKPLEVIDTPRRAIVSGVREVVDLFDSDPNTKASFGDWLNQTGDTTYGFGKAFGNFTDSPWLNRVIGFVGDVALDPLTYLTGGAGVAARSGLFAHGAAGRLAMATRVMEITGDAAKAGRVAKEGWVAARSVLTEAEQAAMGMAKAGLYFGGKRVPAVRVPLTGLVDEGLSRATTRLRIAATSTKTGSWLQRAATSSWLPEERLQLLRGEVPAEKVAEKLVAVGAQDAYRSTVGQAMRDVSALMRTTVQDSGIESDQVLRSRIYRLLENPALMAAASPAEQRAAQAWEGTFKRLWDMLDSKLKAIDPEGKVGQVQRYFPHVPTDEARTFLAGGSKAAKELAEQLGQDALGPTTFFNPRMLVADGKTKFFGYLLQTGDDTVERLNQIARQHGGFAGDFFETDIGSVAAKYGKMWSDQMGRLGVTEHLVAKGQIALIERKMVTDPSVVAEGAQRLTNAMSEHMRVLRDVADLHRNVAKAVSALDEELNQRIVGLAGEGVAANTARRASSLQAGLDLADLTTGHRELVKRLDAMRDEFRSMFGPDAENSIADFVDQEIAAARQSLEDIELHVDMAAYTANVTADELVDAKQAVKAAAKDLKKRLKFAEEAAQRSQLLIEYHDFFGEAVRKMTAGEFEDIAPLVFESSPTLWELQRIFGTSEKSEKALARVTKQKGELGKWLLEQSDLDPFVKQLVGRIPKKTLEDMTHERLLSIFNEAIGGESTALSQQAAQGLLIARTLKFFGSVDAMPAEFRKLYSQAIDDVKRLDDLVAYEQAVAAGVKQAPERVDALLNMDLTTRAMFEADMAEYVDLQEQLRMISNYVREQPFPSDWGELHDVKVALRYGQGFYLDAKVKIDPGAILYSRVEEIPGVKASLWEIPDGQYQSVADEVRAIKARMDEIETRRYKATRNVKVQFNPDGKAHSRMLPPVVDEVARLDERLDKLFRFKPKPEPGVKTVRELTTDKEVKSLASVAERSAGKVGRPRTSKAAWDQRLAEIEARLGDKPPRPADFAGDPTVSDAVWGRGKNRDFEIADILYQRRQLQNRGIGNEIAGQEQEMTFSSLLADGGLENLDRRIAENQRKAPQALAGSAERQNPTVSIGRGTMQRERIRIGGLDPVQERADIAVRMEEFYLHTEVARRAAMLAEKMGSIGIEIGDREISAILRAVRLDRGAGGWMASGAAATEALAALRELRPMFNTSALNEAELQTAFGSFMEQLTAKVGKQTAKAAYGDTAAWTSTTQQWMGQIRSLESRIKNTAAGPQRDALRKELQTLYNTQVRPWYKELNPLSKGTVNRRALKMAMRETGATSRETVATIDRRLTDLERRLERKVNTANRFSSLYDQMLDPDYSAKVAAVEGVGARQRTPSTVVVAREAMAARLQKLVDNLLETTSAAEVGRAQVATEQATVAARRSEATVALTGALTESEKAARKRVGQLQSQITRLEAHELFPAALQDHDMYTFMHMLAGLEGHAVSSSEWLKMGVTGRSEAATRSAAQQVWDTAMSVGGDLSPQIPLQQKKLVESELQRVTSMLADTRRQIGYIKPDPKLEESLRQEVARLETALSASSTGRDEVFKLNQQIGSLRLQAGMSTNDLERRLLERQVAVLEAKKAGFSSSVTDLATSKWALAEARKQLAELSAAPKNLENLQRRLGELQQKEQELVAALGGEQREVMVHRPNLGYAIRARGPEAILPGDRVEVIISSNAGGTRRVLKRFDVPTPQMETVNTFSEQEWRSLFLGHLPDGMGEYNKARGVLVRLEKELAAAQQQLDSFQNVTRRTTPLAVETDAIAYLTRKVEQQRLIVEAMHPSTRQSAMGKMMEFYNGMVARYGDHPFESTRFRDDWRRWVGKKPFANVDESTVRWRRGLLDQAHDANPTTALYRKHQDLLRQKGETLAQRDAARASVERMQEVVDSYRVKIADDIKDAFKAETEAQVALGDELAALVRTRTADGAIPVSDELAARVTEAFSNTNGFEAINTVVQNGEVARLIEDIKNSSFLVSTLKGRMLPGSSITPEAFQYSDWLQQGAIADVATAERKFLDAAQAEYAATDAAAAADKAAADAVVAAPSLREAAEKRLSDAVEFGELYVFEQAKAFNQLKRVEGRVAESAVRVHDAQVRFDQSLAISPDEISVAARTAAANQSRSVLDGMLTEWERQRLTDVASSTPLTKAERDNLAKQVASGKKADKALAAGTTKGKGGKVRSLSEKDVESLTAKVQEGLAAEVRLRAATMSDVEAYELRDLMTRLDAVRNIAKGAGVQSEVVDAYSAVLDAALVGQQRLALSEQQVIKAEQFLADPANIQKVVPAFRDGWTSLEKWRLPSYQASPELQAMFDNVSRMEVPVVARELSQFLGRYTRFFKAWAVATPGFHIRNALSNTFMVFAAGGEVQNMTRAVKLYEGWLSAVRAGAEQSWINGLEESERARVMLAVRVMDAAGPGQQVEALNDLAQNAKKSMLSDNVWLRANRRFGERVEGSARFMLAYDSVAKGMDLNMGTARVKRFLFDYGDKSLLDQSVGTIIPFWTWMSRNLPLQIVNRWANPRAYLMYAHFMRNANQDDSGDVVPSWLKEQGAANIGGGWYLNPDMPQSRISQQFAEFADPKRLLSYVNPALRLPIELAGGRQLYNDVPFSNRPQQVTGGPAQPLVEALLGLLGQTKTVGPQGVKDSNGKMIMQPGETATNAQANYALMNLLPLLAQSERLLPATDPYEQRQTASLLGFMGVPVRQVTPTMQEQEIERRKRQMAAMASAATRMGYTP